jgi:hypothetical protein
MSQITLIALWSRPADADRFDRDYLDTHVPIVRSDDIEAVEQSILLLTNDASDYHRAAVLTFADPEAFARATASDGWARLRANGRRLEAEHGVALTIVTGEGDR